jgi:hypothetical protein
MVVSRKLPSPIYRGEAWGVRPFSPFLDKDKKLVCKINLDFFYFK